MSPLLRKQSSCAPNSPNIGTATSKPPPPSESASHPQLLVAAPLPISSPSQQHRRSIVRVKSAVAVFKHAVFSAAVRLSDVRIFLELLLFLTASDLYYEVAL
ncbi:hypothetical protein PIB30_052566 [Stylosanthes scabra]|uniref:Uncharacterized protein n=1 Tax=Stylosanthes scabra TaxID=79078 RepID=A0ABU6XH57_9FABA|nr:hypothetical protein [Stylosanthes scabra]